MKRRTDAYPKDERIRWYRAVDKEKQTVKDVCEIFHIPRKTYYKWRKHDFRGGGTYVPHKEHPNTKMTSEVKKIIEEVKFKTNYGPLKMQMHVDKIHHIQISTTIIYRFYKVKRLIRKPQKKSPWFAPMKHKLRITHQGEGVQCDVKYVYEDGKRKYQFSIFDPFTELYHFTICDTKESKNAITALHKAQRYFGFTIQSVQTDNGSEYRGVFHQYCEKYNIPHYFIPKKSPWWNAQVERVHRTIDEEYYHNPHRVWASPIHWLEYYNTERIHLTLDGLTPREKLESVTCRC